MMCPHCERHITQALSSIPGVTDVKADHKTGTVTITSTEPLDDAEAARVVQQAGYEYKGKC
jgi:copper chaperone CopZ